MKNPNDTIQKSDKDRALEIAEFMVSNHPELLRKISVTIGCTDDLESLEVEFCNGIDDGKRDLVCGDDDVLVARVGGTVPTEVLRGSEAMLCEMTGAKRALSLDDSIKGIFVLRMIHDRVSAAKPTEG